ncbi:MAG: glycosyltransferase family 4 protein [Eubacteriales bacterium]
MNILIVSQYFYPEDFRINDIAVSLVERGHQVTVITGLPNYGMDGIPREYRFFKKRKEVYKGVKVIRMPITARRKGAFWRILNYKTFALFGAFYAKTAKIDFDCVFTYEISPVTVGIPAISFARRKKKKHLFYCIDIWPEAVLSWGGTDKGIIYKIAKKISNYVYKRCDLIAVSSEPFEDYLNEKMGVDKSRITYLPQHCDDIYSNIAGKYTDNSCTDFMYIGNIGSVQDVECIIRAAKDLKDKEGFHIHIVGNGSNFDNVKNLSLQYGLDKIITFYGRIPYSELEELYILADAFLITLKGDSYIGNTLPAKLQSYMSVGKPVIGAINGAGANEVYKSGCGKVASSGDSETLAKIMLDVIKNPDIYKECGKSGRKYYEDNYTKDKFIDKLLNLFYSLLKGEK